MYQKTTLPNGLRVLTETMPAVRSASIGVWADVGSALETRESRGISHLVEHMLFKGTTRRSARAIAETMDGVGGNLNAFTDKETTCYYAKVIDRHVPLALDVLADMFLNSTFDQGELAKEQNVVLEEIKMYEDSPDELIHDLFLQTMWNGANLGEPTIGFADSVVKVNPDDLRAHMRGHYAPNSVVVAAAGNVEHERFVEEVAEQFASFKGACALPRAEAPPTTPAVHVRHKDSEQAYVVLGTRGLSVRDERRYALSLLDTILGGGMSSRLFQEIREKRGLVYTVYSFQAAYREAGLFGVYAGTSPEHVQSCIDLTVEEFHRISDVRVGDDELHLAKEHMKGNLTLSLESTSSRMIRLGRNEFALGRYLSPEEIEARIDAVTPEEVQELAQELLPDRNLGLCVIGPVDESTIAWNRDAA
ncbi:MAG TPA: pitrilysin family protein [Candidatus Baltobacteraceae bacterium]|jgi:predicted Zn-dependent peptidase|nr:pitrilysin family protein [Candidatus Baltobacteraceae bacterium]